MDINKRRNSRPTEAIIKDIVRDMDLAIDSWIAKTYDVAYDHTTMAYGLFRSLTGDEREDFALRYPTITKLFRITPEHWRIDDVEQASNEVRKRVSRGYEHNGVPMWMIPILEDLVYVYGPVAINLAEQYGPEAVEWVKQHLPAKGYKDSHRGGDMSLEYYQEVKGKIRRANTKEELRDADKLRYKYYRQHNLTPTEYDLLNGFILEKMALLGIQRLYNERPKEKEVEEEEEAVPEEFVPPEEELAELLD